MLGFLFLVLTLVAFCTSQRQARVATLLNRQQTEEWKGWMQVCIRPLSMQTCKRCKAGQKISLCLNDCPSED